MDLPEHYNWSRDECLKFNDMVVWKPFVAIVKSREMSKGLLKEIILNLELIDTSTEEDINISDFFKINERKESHN